jgi:vancomycin aglycone glucosyltransferase
MRILLSTYGSRGDVQPLAALALALRRQGVEAVVSTPADAEFVALLDRFDIPMAPAFMPVREWIAWARASGLKIPGFAARMLPAQFEAIRAAAAGCDAIVATGLFPSVAAARMVAETTGMPYVMAAFSPTSLPSPDHPPVARPGWPHPPGLEDNAALWSHDAEAMDGLFREVVNRQRRVLGLPPVQGVRDHVFTRSAWLAADPVLGPWRDSRLHAAIQTGAWRLPDDRPLPDEVTAFLEAGPPPVYVGFGSMPMQGPDSARIAVEAVRRQGRRIILARGWADLSTIDVRDDCLLFGEVNQQALFPRTVVVVHHGGAGTTMAAARAGAPQVIAPQLVDQPYWGGRVAELGVGVVLPGPAPTLDGLSAALASTLGAETVDRARQVAATIRDDGADQAATRLIDLIGDR